MPFRDPRDQEPEKRTPSLLEQRLQVTRNERGLSVEHDKTVKDEVTVWRPLVEAAAKSHRSERGTRRGRAGRGGTRRLKWLWVVALILVWAGVATVTVLLLRSGQI